MVSVKSCKMAGVKIYTVVFCCLISITTQAVLPVSMEGDVEEDSLQGISTDPNDVQFFLYPNPADPNDADELKFNDVQSVQASRYDSNKRIILYSSGFYQNRTTDQFIKDAYLDAGFAEEANVFIIEWGPLSGNQAKIGEIIGDISIVPTYIAAVSNVNIVGKRVQEFLTFLIQNRFLSGPEKVHCVGMSLGAHVCGKAGYYYKEQTGRLLNRITGNDGAGPLFQGFSKTKRLDKSDAAFVVTVHTNDWGFGYAGDYGTVDFYVNGGKAPQPGCENSSDQFCSHNMAIQFFVKSIQDKSLLAYDCKICSIGAKPTMPFGEYCPESASGSYYIKLNAK